MARRAALTLAIAATLAAISQRAPAQNLARLTVQSFVLSTDATNPKVDVPFHLVLSLRVRERVSQITNLDLPILAELELLGDERVTTSTPRGTQYRETIAVVAHHAGPIAIGSATLQAVDARDGKAKEWYTNGLTLQVAGAGPQMLRDGAHMLRQAAIALLWLLLWLAGAGCIVIAAVWLLRRSRRRAPVTAVSIPTPPPVVERSRRAQAEDALIVLGAERSRSAAVAVRTAIWRMVGASDGETLGDVLRRPGLSEDETMRQLLIALERSAFTYESDLGPAIEDTCLALERYIGSAA